MNAHRTVQGQSLIEFALVFPLLIFVVLALFDIGRGVFYFSTLNTAVREATRDAIVMKYSTANEATLKDAIKGRVLNYLFGVSELTDYYSNCTDPLSTSCTITVKYINIVTPTDPEAIFDPKVQVIATYPFETITPFISFFTGHDGKIPIEVQSTMLLAPVAKP